MRVLSLSAVCLSALLAAPLWADEPVPPPPPVDTGWSGPPATVPAPAPTPPEAVAAPTPQQPLAAPTPVAQARAGGLPPPVVRRGGQRVSLPSAAPAPTTYQPAAHEPPALPITPPLPAAPSYPTTSVAPYTPQAPTTGPLPSVGDAPIVEAPTSPSAIGGEASIVGLVKEHNIRMKDGTLWLGLSTAFRVDGETGGSYRVWITFFNRATGAPIPSTRAAFGDAQGNAHVMTKPVVSAGRGQEFNAPLLVPYTIFPDPGIGRSTEIEARVELTRVEANRQEVPVATSSTTFRVHGAPDPAAATTPVSAFPAPR